MNLKLSLLSLAIGLGGISHYARADVAPPVLLHEENYDHSRIGVDYWTAQKTCKNLRRTHEEKYFFVFCDIHEKNWIETLIGTDTYTDYDVLGYVSEGQVLAVSRGRSSVYSAHFRTAPVIIPVEVPYTYEYSQRFTVYGLRVYGWGHLAELKESLLMTSEGRRGDFSRLTFPTALEAHAECESFALKHAGRTTDFYRSRCEARALDDGSFAFDIYTRNPFFQEAP